MRCFVPCRGRGGRMPHVTRGGDVLQVSSTAAVSHHTHTKTARAGSLSLSLMLEVLFIQNSAESRVRSIPVAPPPRA